MAGNTNILLAYGTSSPAVNATWDPLNKGTTVTLSSSNSVATTGGGPTGEVRATKSFLSSASNLAIYYKVTAGTNFAVAGCSTTTPQDAVMGFDNGSGNLNQYTGQNTNTWGWYANINASAGILHNAGFVGSGCTCYSIGDELALVVNAGTFQFYKNGVATCVITPPVGTYYPAVGTGSSAITFQEIFAPNTPTHPIGGTTQY